MNEAYGFNVFKLHGALTVCLCLSPRPVKSPLKVQNGVQEADSPIKKVAKRSRQILDSDDEEAPVVKEQILTKGQGDKEAHGKIEKVKAIYFS